MDKLNNIEMVPCIKADDIDQIKISVGKISDTQSAILASQKRIEMQILGDPDAKIEGIASKVERHEQSIQVGQRIAWIAIGICGFASILWTIFVALNK